MKRIKNDCFIKHVKGDYNKNVNTVICFYVPNAEEMMLIGKKYRIQLNLKQQVGTFMLN